MELMTAHPLIRFLIEELAVSKDSIVLALQHSEQMPSLLPITLWKYGFITLSELNEIFDWLEQQGSIA